MAGWGNTKPGSQGWDGRDGNQPRNSTITNNLVREIGFFEKQSSAWFQVVNHIFLSTLHSIGSCSQFLVLVRQKLQAPPLRTIFFSTCQGLPLYVANHMFRFSLSSIAHIYSELWSTS